MDDTNTGNQNTGNQNTGNWNTGNQNTGNQNTGNWNTGNRNTGNRNTGYQNTGYQNTGCQNPGNRNTGDRNTGNRNTGNRNTGDWNTGNWNTGNQNIGYQNTGNRNTGDRNTGNWNTGDWNTGDWNTGCFNTITPEGGYFFNKYLSFEEWSNAKKPGWIYQPATVTWICERDMTNQEKIENPTFRTCGGYLRKNDMREEWKKAYEDTSEEEIQMVRDLPNFDYDVFEEITGLDLRARADPCDGKIVEIDGKKYRLTEV